MLMMKAQVFRLVSLRALDDRFTGIAASQDGATLRIAAMTTFSALERSADNGEVVRVDPKGPLLYLIGAATDLAVDVAVAGTGIVHLFEDWLRPYLNSGVLEPVLEPWWQRFLRPFLYYPGRRLVPAPLRAFVDFIKASANHAWCAQRRAAALTLRAAQRLADRTRAGSKRR